MSPRVREDSVRPRLQSGARIRPLNFPVRRHMSDTLRVLLCLALFLAIAGYGVWSTTKCLRRGVFFARFGAQISRLENPILFWSCISMAYVASAGALFIVLWVVGVLSMN
jgi:hypothetical protein